MTPQARQCERCHRTIEQRGPTPVRFCPVCGQALSESQPAGAVTSAARSDTRSRTSVQAVLGLILAVVSLVIQPCAFPLGLVSVLLGLTAQKSIERSAGLLVGRGYALWAVVLGLISLIVWLIINVFVRPGHHEYASF